MHLEEIYDTNEDLGTSFQTSQERSIQNNGNE